MKFIVKFWYPNGYAIDVWPYRPGTRLLTEVREKAGCRVPLDLIAELVSSLSENSVQVEISPELAYEIPHFEEKGEVLVNVPHRGLNKYTYVTPVIYRDAETGGVTQVRFSISVDTERLLDDWVASGAPLNWTAEPPEAIEE